MGPAQPCCAAGKPSPLVWQTCIWHPCWWWGRYGQPAGAASRLRQQQQACKGEASKVERVVPAQHGQIDVPVNSAYPRQLLHTCTHSARAKQRTNAVGPEHCRAACEGCRLHVAGSSTRASARRSGAGLPRLATLQRCRTALRRSPGARPPYFLASCPTGPLLLQPSLSRCSRALLPIHPLAIASLLLTI